jgi:hypothetical protein
MKVNELVEKIRIDKRDTSLGMCNTLCVLCILNVYDYHWVDTTVGEPIVSNGIANPVIRTLIYITTTGYTPRLINQGNNSLFTKTCELYWLSNLFILSVT